VAFENQLNVSTLLGDELMYGARQEVNIYWSLMMGKISSTEGHRQTDLPGE
jgi:hypothetical protein